ncbi:MAG: hypothetical protein B6D62_01395 [Candidatus Cloacimonas sp. 4484_275]|nr:MAG: hypothetical protein B6D62_01395 [Candidatus Cloacimonas sp. 4484_275]RLC51574.1 MAG: guanine deaminase [Candidatus Cloacimonadota bacterium]
MIIKTNVLSPISPHEAEFRKNVFITINQTKIISISKESANGDFEDFSDCVCIPGLIDTHVHLSQFYVRGKHSSDLLDWLQKYIFQAELKSKDESYARKIAEDFFSATVKAGTTTAVIYTAPFKQACESAFEIAKDFGVRAIIGKTMMDCNSPDFLRESTEKSLKESIELFEKWNKSTPLLEYVFSPRFAPVCSSKLMKSVGEFARKNNAYIQTHLSENPDEIKLVKKLFPQFDSYTEVYEKHGILGEKTILGHVIHISEKELNIIKNTNSKIAHCPDSNFFLKSGAFPYERIKNTGIEMALASDVAAGTSLSMFNVMKMFNYRQDNYVVSPQEAFYYATLGGAKILGKDNIIGSVEIGKEADLTFLKIPDIAEKNKDTLLSELLYLGTEKKIKAVFVAGKTFPKFNFQKY